MEEQTKLWRHLADEAAAGRLYLDSDVVAGCRDACNRQIDLYESVRRDLRWLANVGGFGDFDCADALATMLGAKAIGGDRDVDTALREHIEVLMLIRDTIEVSVDRLTAQESLNRNGIESAGEA